MEQIIKSPVQIFLNGRFYCIADQVEIKPNSKEFKDSLLPDNVKLDPSQFTGTVINIIKTIKVKGEDAEVKKEIAEKEYDEFFQRMVKDPERHIPIV